MYANERWCNASSIFVFRKPPEIKRKRSIINLLKYLAKIVSHLKAFYFPWNKTTKFTTEHVARWSKSAKPTLGSATRIITSHCSRGFLARALITDDRRIKELAVNLARMTAVFFLELNFMKVRIAPRRVWITDRKSFFS